MSGLLGLPVLIFLQGTGLIFASKLDLLPTGRNRFEGKIIVDYGNGTKSPVCSQGVTQHDADIMCNMAGYAGATRIYPRSQCFKGSHNLTGSIVSLMKSGNLTDIASSFRLADCGCCRRRHHLSLRCFGEGAIELENNQTIDENNGVEEEGRVIIYTNGSWWRINAKSSGSIQCYICPSIGLVNYQKCKTSIQERYHLRYGKSNITNVAPYSWNCPRVGNGTLDNCSRTEPETQSKDPYILTKSCLLPADNRLQNYILCQDTDEIVTDSFNDKCEAGIHCFEQHSNITVDTPPGHEAYVSVPNHVPLKVAVPIIAFILMCVIGLVHKRRHSHVGHNSDKVQEGAAGVAMISNDVTSSGTSVVGNELDEVKISES